MEAYQSTTPRACIILAKILKLELSYLFPGVWKSNGVRKRPFSHQFTSEQSHDSKMLCQRSARVAQWGARRYNSSCAHKSFCCLSPLTALDFTLLLLFHLPISPTLTFYCQLLFCSPKSALLTITLIQFCRATPDFNRACPTMSRVAQSRSVESP